MFFRQHCSDLMPIMWSPITWTKYWILFLEFSDRFFSSTYNFLFVVIHRIILEEKNGEKTQIPFWPSFLEFLYHFRRKFSPRYFFWNNKYFWETIILKLRDPEIGRSLILKIYWKLFFLIDLHSFLLISIGVV